MKNGFLQKLTAIGLACMMTASFAACSNKTETAPSSKTVSIGSSEASQNIESASETEKAKEQAEETLFVYAGAGLRKATDEIAKVYKEKNHVKVEFSYAGSAQLISQMELSQKGDLFIVGSEDVYKSAQKKGLVGDYQTVAHHTPVIAVPKENPAGITSLEDMAKKGVKVILGDAKSNAIGQTAQKILEKNNLKSINNNVVSTAATVNEIVLQLTSGKVDAAIVTADSVYGNSDIKVIEIASEQNIDQIIPIGVVSYSTKKETAQALADFIASDKGKEIFKKQGFQPVDK